MHGTNQLRHAWLPTVLAAFSVAINTKCFWISFTVYTSHLISVPSGRPTTHTCMHQLIYRSGSSSPESKRIKQEPRAMSPCPWEGNRSHSPCIILLTCPWKWYPAVAQTNKSGSTCMQETNQPCINMFLLKSMVFSHEFIHYTSSCSFKASLGCFSLK